VTPDVIAIVPEAQRIALMTQVKDKEITVQQMHNLLLNLAKAQQAKSQSAQAAPALPDRPVARTLPETPVAAPADLIYDDGTPVLLCVLCPAPSLPPRNRDACKDELMDDAPAGTATAVAGTAAGGASPSVDSAGSGWGGPTDLYQNIRAEKPVATTAPAPGVLPRSAGKPGVAGPWFLSHRSPFSGFDRH
jgi:hypothetical protein